MAFQNRIPFCLTLLLICFIACAGTAGASSANDSAPGATTDSGDIPFADVPQTTHDFGTITHGGEYEHDFIVRNLGTVDLEITAVRVG